MTNWKSATCEACVFRDGKLCRRFPNPALVAYGGGEFHKACAEYTEEGQPTPFERASKLAVDKGAVAAMDAMTGSVRKPLTTYDVAQEAWKESR